MTIGDCLLYAISARGHMPWPAVKRAFDCLYEPLNDAGDPGPLRYRRGETIRTLENLAHVEFDNRSQQMRIAATPPTIAILPGRGLPKGVLTGARSQAQIERLSATARRTTVLFDVQKQTWNPHLYPSRISLAADNLDELMAFALDQGLQCTATPAAWSIVNVAGSLDDYMRTLLPAHQSSLNWEREDFDPQTLSFDHIRRQDNTLLSRYTHPTRRYRLHVLYQEGTGSLVDAEWGRFAALRAIERNVLAYDSLTFQFVVPVAVPLPKLLARALCLCSGFVPSGPNEVIPANPGLRVYHRVPLSLAQAIADKLAQHLEFRQFSARIPRRKKRG